MRQHRITKRSTASLAVLLSAAALLLTMGCKRGHSTLTEEQAERGLGLPDTSSDGQRIKIDPRCPANQLVEDPERDTPEWVLHELYSAAADTSGDEAANFQRFASHFPPTTEVRWIRDQYWSRAKKFVTKYLQKDAADGIAIKICERRESDNGELKLFVQSLDPQKSNTPVTVKKDDAGQWKVVFYTP